MEITLASPNHTLYLGDVMRRLEALRGKGMAAMYSWSGLTDEPMKFNGAGGTRLDSCGMMYPRMMSCCRHRVAASMSSKDLSCPKATRKHLQVGKWMHVSFMRLAFSDQEQQSFKVVPKVQCVKPTAEEESPTPSWGSQQAGWMTNPSSTPPPQPLQKPQQVLCSVSPSSSTTKESDQESARSSSSGSSSSPNKLTNRGSGGATPSSSGSRCSPSPPPSFTPNSKEHKSVQSSTIAAQDTAKQTDEVPTGRELHRTKNDSSGRSGSLQSLIRAEALVRRGGCGDTSTRILLEDDESSLVDDKEAVHSLGARLKPANLLMRLMACGSTRSMSHHSACGFMRTTHKPKYMQHHLDPPPPSPVLSPLGALVMRPETTGIRTVSESGDSGSCSCRWSVPQTVDKGDGTGKGMPPSSYDPNRVSEKQTSNKGNSENSECRSRIAPQITRMAPCEQTKSETLVTITTDVSDNSAEHECGNEPSSVALSRSKSMTDPSAAKTRSPKLVRFHDEKQKMFKIEERIASGARVIIQCAPMLKETYVRAP